MTTLKNKDIQMGLYTCYFKKDVKQAILDYKMYQYIYNWRAKNIGSKDSKEITDKINHLEKTYNCKYYELSFDNIFGDFSSDTNNTSEKKDTKRE